MVWSHQSSRRAQLPRDWSAVRKRVLVRDGYTCVMRGAGCTGRATHVDHMDTAIDHNDHRDEVLRSLCSHCHMVRTSMQGHDAMRLSRSRKTAQHPGILW